MYVSLLMHGFDIRIFEYVRIICTLSSSTSSSSVPMELLSEASLLLKSSFDIDLMIYAFFLGLSLTISDGIIILFRPGLGRGLEGTTVTIPDSSSSIMDATSLFSLVAQVVIALICSFVHFRIWYVIFSGLK